MALSGSCDCEDKVRKKLSDRPVDETLPESESVDSSKPKESEPNDSPKDANTFHLLQEFRPISGELSSAADIDWFALTAQQEGVYELTITPESELDVVIHLSGTSQATQPVTYNIAGVGENETVPLVWLDSKPVYFAMQSVGSMAGNYEIGVLRKLSAGNLEREPNDSIETALPLQLSDEIQGMFERPNDRDIYVIETEDLATLRIDYKPAPNVPQVLWLYDDPKLVTPLSSMEISEGAKPVVVPAFAVGSRIPLYLVVSSTSGFDRQAYYTLKTTALGEIAPDIEVEPNDRIPQVLQGTTLRGAFHSSEDTDRFVPAKEEPVVVPEGENPPGKLRWKRSLQIQVSPLNENVTLGVSLMLAGVETRLSSEEKKGALGCGILYSSGDLEVVVRPVELRAPGEMFDYQISLSHPSDDPFFEIEPNNTREEADTLETHRTGYMEEVVARDLFLFEVKERLEKVQITAGGKGLNLKLTLEDEHGGLVATSNLEGAALEKIDVELPAGRYFATVEFAGDGVPPCELYRISLSRKVLVAGLEGKELPQGAEEQGEQNPNDQQGTHDQP